MTTAAAIAFLVSALAVVYTYAGYPVLVAAWARLRPRPVRRATFEPAVTIVVVVHNGAAIIGRKVASCLAQDYPADRLRMMVVSDGSDDATCALVGAMDPARVRLLAFPQRRGKAACLNDAMRAATDAFVVLTDARQRLDPLAVRRLLENFADERVGAASGELVFEQDGMTDFGRGLDAYWRLEKFLRRSEAIVHSTVGVTGALYALRREFFREIPADTVLDDVLIPMNVVMQGRRVVFEAGAHAFDAASHDFTGERTRKVRTLAGNFQLVASRPDLLLPWRDPIAVQFLSHKVARLAAPFFMAVALASNAVLALREPPGAWMALLAAQLAFYACAAAGALWPAAARAAPVRLARAFVSLNWFVVLGFVEYAFNPNPHLWKSTTPRPNDKSSV